MDQETLALFREQLEGMLAELDEEAAATVDDMRHDSALFPDPTDRASLESERNLTLRIRDRERKLRSKIEEALERIEDGTFGICEECEEEIAESRLRARPVTTLCVRCKQLQEHTEEKHNLG